MEPGPVADRILAMLETAGDPVPVETISTATGLPANTLRRHIELLLARGQIIREREAPTGRGRPRWLYRKGSSEPQLFGSLLSALTAQLANSDNQRVVTAVAENWAQLTPLITHRDTPDGAVEATAAALSHLGFAAEVNPPGDSISLTRCPYAALVEKNPVICNIHGVLVAKLLEQTEQEVSMESLDVWAGQRLCVVHLNRPDIKRERKITPADLVPTRREPK